MLKFIAVAVVGLMLSGCALLGQPNEFIETNRMILSANATSKQAFAAALAVCKGEPGCLVGVSMAYATNIGDRDLVQPERTSEIMKNTVPFVSLALQAVDLFYGGIGSGSNGAYVIKGDNNTISGVGNYNESSGGSTTNAEVSSSNTFSWSADNNQDASHDNAYADPGVVATDTTSTDPVIVTDE